MLMKQEMMGFLNSSQNKPLDAKYLGKNPFRLKAAKWHSHTNTHY